jgi:hypothetical protein
MIGVKALALIVRPSDGALLVSEGETDRRQASRVLWAVPLNSESLRRKRSNSPQLATFKVELQRLPRGKDSP